MKPILAIFGREIRAYFLSPLAYIVLFCFLVVNGFLFAYIVSLLNDPAVPAMSQPLGLLFSSLILWLLFPFLLPLLTMRLLAEERRTGSIEVLMTAPVTEDQVVVGKYLGALAFYAFLWVPTVLYGVILNVYGEVDWGPILAAYLGLITLGAFFLAIGTFASALSKNQLIAAVLTFLILLALIFGVLWLEGLLEIPPVKQALGYMNVIEHQDDFSRGIVDTRRLVYYLSGTVFFLFLAGRVLESNKWS